METVEERNESKEMEKDKMVGNIIDRTFNIMRRRKEKLLVGGINSVPSPFARFRGEFLGIERGKYYCVTSTTKGGKTQFASYMFLYIPLLYAYDHPEQLRLKVFYYSLEESVEDVVLRFMSFLLNHLSKGDIRVSPQDLLSSDNQKPISEEILGLLDDGEYREILDFFNEKVEFMSSRNPTGAYNDVKRYMQEHGTVHKKKAVFKDELGNTNEVEVFDYYVPNDPDELVIVFWDHASLTQVERGMTLKQSIDKLSEYFVLLRNNYGVSPVLIQQQMFENEGLEAQKMNKLRPSAMGLADSKYSARDCNVLLGLFCPFKFELPEYKKYDITKLRDNCRFLEVILQRGGQSGGLIALYHDGKTCSWAELPRAEDISGMARVYRHLEGIREKAIPATLFFFHGMSKMFNRFVGNWKNINFTGKF